MIQAVSAITYIENGLRNLLANGQMFGKINRSNTTLSVYLNTKVPTNPPQKTVRSSNHHANMQNMLTGRKKPWNTKNISIEFYEPQFKKSGKPLPNILLTKVRQLSKSPTIKPFSLTVYEYKASEMDMADIDAIFQEIVNYVNSGFYKDPFINTEKMAQVTTREADIPGAVKPSKNDVRMNISNGGYGADYVVDESKVKMITMSESQLRQIIRESIENILLNNSILNEGKLGRALGAAALGGALMFGHPQDANAQLKNVRVQSEMPQYKGFLNQVDTLTGSVILNERDLPKPYVLNSTGTVYDRYARALSYIRENKEQFTILFNNSTTFDYRPENEDEWTNWETMTNHINPVAFNLISVIRDIEDYYESNGKAIPDIVGKLKEIRSRMTKIGVRNNRIWRQMFEERYRKEDEMRINNYENELQDFLK